MIKKYFFCLTMLSVFYSVTAQDSTFNPGGGSGSGSEVNLEEDAGNGQGPGGGVPVDGGLAFLLVAGASYGAKKAYDYRKNKVKSEK